MQTFGWYLRRLRAMSLGEALLRAQSSVRDRLDRYRHAGFVRRAAAVARDCVAQDAAAWRPEFARHLHDSSALGAIRARLGRAEHDLAAAAERAAAGRLTLLGGETVDCGVPMRWNRDPRHGVGCPLHHAADIDYRDFREVGDCKWVWEPARCHHFVLLGRAYAITGERRFAEALAGQWQSWLDQCPFGRGMHWRSPLELGIRLINWVYAHALVMDSGVIDRSLLEQILRSVELHQFGISRKYSYGSSANNHLIGEAAGVFVAACFYDQLPAAARRREEAARILAEQIVAQTNPDGSNVEGSVGYHAFAMQFFLIAALAARAIGRDFDPAYWLRLRSQMEYLAALAEGGDSLPMFNDADDGYVLDLDQDPRSPRAWLSVGAALFQEPRYRSAAGDSWQPVFWLLGESGLEQYTNLAPPPAGRLHSRCFSDAGVYLLQGGEKNEVDDRVSVTVDCGPLGYGALAAHGHADALALTLRCFGAELLTDPGTFDYFTHRAWRDYLRSTAAHNTIRVDGQDQSEMLGLFQWGRQARARCIAWEPGPDGGRIVVEQDGYCRLRDPVMHRRTVEVSVENPRVLVIDEITASGTHTIEQYWHLSEHCRLRNEDQGQLEFDLPGGIARIEIDPSLRVRLVRGTEQAGPGWVSRGYHQRCCALSVAAIGRSCGRARFETRITLLPKSKPAGDGNADGSVVRGRAFAEAGRTL